VGVSFLVDGDVGKFAPEERADDKLKDVRC